jgi:hypothetical protein
MPYEVLESQNANEIKLEVIGSLDESSMLPDRSRAEFIRLDLRQVKTINSTGVRNFVKWGELHKHVKSIKLENCPSIFVKNFSMITGFLKPNMTVVSFLVPFYCEETNESMEVTFLRDKDFDSQGNYKIPVIKDSQGNVMEVDVQPESFFGFLKK